MKSLAVIPLVASIVLATSCQQNTESALAGIKPLNPAGAVVPVRVVRTSTGYELQRGGKPYHIKGVAGVQHLDLIRQKGGNSVRIYTANYADILLDEAHRNGLTVMFGLWMRPSYEKFDYYDPKAVAMQQQQIYEQVLRYKNHPSLLMWNLGNELNNHTLDMKVYQVVNETAQVIHRLDPNHPVTTTLTSSTFPIPAIARLCPDLDVITINVFNTLGRHAQDLKAAGWSGPFVIGEFGGRGWWEAPQTSWGAPLDQSGSEKAELMGRNYESTVASNGSHCLGSYALYWGNRFEQTDMWLSMFAPTGEKTPMVDMMQYLWTKTEPENQAPKVGVMLLDSKPDSLSVALKPNLEYTASVSAFDPDGDSLAVQWKVTRDVDEFHTLPQNRTAPEAIPSAIRQAKGTTALIRAPAQEGAYRLLVNVYDKKGSVTTNSFPFYVGQPKRPDVVVSTGK
ncbi:hypothetical protein MTX78_19840 [Hymenobacter tibetensis]|uniref:Glycoside hydrolase family 2 catalytic domain-containing protein n=1 Tax=Hymenobacter tibetensis TaxID=497967 RepID=A0ABY4CWE3_9BACT|nr:glycoside hydrolase family 2 TIM barrel-domain containing protein [Hymenobacter tibetensis]UOG74357.1 hypothetical protein MTX78_19840 [Hymenobacter tibetensis]